MRGARKLRRTLRKNRLMPHEHVRIVVTDALMSGSENVPAKRRENGFWELERSPLYAMHVAAGDVIRVIDSDLGTFEIVRRGGNVSVYFYLGSDDADNLEITSSIAHAIEAKLVPLNGRMDGITAGLIVFSVSCKVGFAAIERVFEEAVRIHPGAQWQYGNVYDPITDAPLLWWK